MTWIIWTKKQLYLVEEKEAVILITKKSPLQPKSFLFMMDGFALCTYFNSPRWRKLQNCILAYVWSLQRYILADNYQGPVEFVWIFSWFPHGIETMNYHGKLKVITPLVRRQIYLLIIIYVLLSWRRAEYTMFFLHGCID
jgi:hypothetical protein